MKIQLIPEQQAELAKIAQIAAEFRFLAAVEKGLAAAERGELIEEDEMDARLEAMFKA